MVNKRNKLKNLIWTPHEKEVIKKKLSGAKLKQQDSNYLSKFIRPKLKEMILIEADGLLNKLCYNQKAISIEKRIKYLILKNLKEVDSITLYGSAIQNNYISYNDIDVLIIVKRKFWEKLREKYKKILEIKHALKKYSLNTDLEIYDKKTFYKLYSKNPSLVYQLKDRKTIYGRLKLKNKIEISKLDLRMKLDYSIIDKEANGLEIYKAIRNLILIRLILEKIINNQVLNKLIKEEVGEKLSSKLKNNQESSIEKKIAMLHLKELLNLTLRKLENEKWEKMTLLNP